MKAPIPAPQKAPLLIQEGRRISAGGGYPPPTDAALLTPISLARRQDMMSIRKSANFLPVGKDFTIPARNFLPVGKGLRGSPAKVTKRHDGRGRRTQTVVRPVTTKGSSRREQRRRDGAGDKGHYINLVAQVSVLRVVYFVIHGRRADSFWGCPFNVYFEPLRQIRNTAATTAVRRSEIALQSPR